MSCLAPPRRAAGLAPAGDHHYCKPSPRWPDPRSVRRTRRTAPTVPMPLHSFLYSHPCASCAYSPRLLLFPFVLVWMAFVTGVCAGVFPLQRTVLERSRLKADERSLSLEAASSSVAAAYLRPSS